MAIDTEILIIGAGMSGLGFAVQLIRRYGNRNFEIIEKSDDLGGTWWVNKYPGCGCDVPSHFYSYSFALNPDWSKKWALRDEIQKYFSGVAHQYRINQHIRLNTSVETADWDDATQTWLVGIYDATTKRREKRRCKILISAVGGLSVPRECEIPGADRFTNPLFHSAQWDHSFDWNNKSVVVLGNGCSATQFVPVMSDDPGAVAKITQFSRQAHYLSERDDPEYSPLFKAAMRYVPLAMRIYRAALYWEMERDFAGFDTITGKPIRDELAVENVAYVKRTAPEKYWDALIPKYNIGCKRKVLDTNYLAALHRSNVELVPDDPVKEITETGVRTRSGRDVTADAIVLATGFQTSRMLFPMEIRGQGGISLQEHWQRESRGAPQAYLGTCIPSFPNFFVLMGPNTVTGHLSVIYTVECQINFALRLLHPLLSRPLLPIPFLPSIPLLSPSPSSVAVSLPAARADSHSLQTHLSRLVWSSGCTSWALDEKTGLNIMMYPWAQYWFWWRSVVFPKRDFVYRDDKGGEVAVLGRVGRVVGGAAIWGAVVGVGVWVLGRERVLQEGREGWRMVEGVMGRVWAKI